jgi:type II secretory pathway component GspD/PulD (secretin)
VSARHLTHPAPARLTSLTVTMLAICGLAWGEDKPATPADQALKEYADQSGAGGTARAGAEAAADFYYDRGMKALEASRLDDAIHDLTIAVDWQPQNAKYRKALEQAQALAGTRRDARSLHIDQTADQMFAKQQQLWVEAQAKIEEGQKAFEAGDYVEAERSFTLAQTRLESLPFADQRKEPEQRRVESLIAQAKERREKKELQEAAERNQSALDRQRELRDAGLQIERDRIDAMLRRAQKARERRDYDDAILLCDQVLKLNRAEERAHSLQIKCQRERHVYLRQMTADRWDEEHKLLSESIRTAMLPQLELVTYSTEWPQIDARRSAPVQGLQEESEAWRKEINNQLEQEVTLDFQDHDLVDVLNFLQKITNVNIVLDPKVVAASPPPVTLRVESMKLRYVLEFIMKLTNLSYTLRDEAIFVSNAQGLRGDIFMKLYDIRDLTHAMANFPGPDLDLPEPGGQGSRLLPPIEPEAKPEINEFIEIIQKVVKPDSWMADGVAIQEYNGSMVVTQTGEVHKLVAELLRTLRNQKGTQIHVKVKFLTVENSLLEEIGVNWQNFNNANLAQYPGVLNANGALPGQATSAAGVPAPFGAYHQQGSVIAAANLNNTLQPYDNTGHSIPASNLGGLNFQTQHWRLVDDFYVSAVLHAVEKERRGNITFEPDITLFNGQQAHIVHINQQAYIADYDVNQGQYDPIVSTLAYGTVLDVQAIASADKKYITLTLRPTNAQVAQWRRFGPPLNQNQFLGVSGQNGGGQGGNNNFGGAPVQQAGGSVAGTNPLLIPELVYQSVRTSVTIPDGGSLMLAGMTNGESARSHSGVPFLSHIPFLGRLFSSNGRQETELKTLIMLQADVVLFEEIEKKL